MRTRAEPALTSPEGAPRDRGLRYAVRAFKHRDFTLFWSGALASNTGSWVQNLAVPFILYEVT